MLLQLYTGDVQKFAAFLGNDNPDPTSWPHDSIAPVAPPDKALVLAALVPRLDWLTSTP